MEFVFVGNESKKHFSYEADDEPIRDPEEKFRIDFFNTLLDQAIMSLNERFEQLKNLVKTLDSFSISIV